MKALIDSPIPENESRNPAILDTAFFILLMISMITSKDPNATIAPLFSPIFFPIASKNPIILSFILSKLIPASSRFFLTPSLKPVRASTILLKKVLKFISLKEPNTSFLKNSPISLKPIFLRVPSSNVTHFPKFLIRSLNSFILSITPPKVFVNALFILVNAACTFGFSERISIPSFILCLKLARTRHIFANIAFSLSPSSIQSLNLTRASPIDAVTSRILRSKAPRTAEINLKANENPPPINVLTTSKIANKPLKVLLIFSALSSLMIKFLVKSRILVIIFVRFSAVIGGNISRKASFIGVITLPRASQTFLKDSIKSSLPPSSVIPEISSLTEPNNPSTFPEASSKAFKRYICLYCVLDIIPSVLNTLNTELI